MEQVSFKEIQTKVVSNNFKNIQLGSFNDKAFIFDLDGVITDTTNFHYFAWFQAFNALPKLINKPSIDINKKIYDDVIDGAPREKTIRKIMCLFGIKCSRSDVFEISQYKNKKYMSFIRKNGIHLFKDTIDLIAVLKRFGSKLGVATSSKNGHEILKMAKLEHFFDFIATGQEILTLGLEPKPAPDIFNLVIKQLGTDIKNVFIFEDSHVGLRSAIATGCKNIIYADRKSININLRFKYRLENVTRVLDLL